MHPLLLNEWLFLTCCRGQGPTCVTGSSGLSCDGGHNDIIARCCLGCHGWVELLFQIAKLWNVLILWVPAPNLPPTFWAGLSHTLSVKMHSTPMHKRKWRTDLLLWSNQVTHIELGAFDSLTALKRLDLSKNHISHINNGTMETLTKLEVLHLYGNNISHIEDGAFHSLGHLVELRLDSNCIGSLGKDTLRGLHRLEQLDLDNNQIYHLDERAFESLEKLEVLLLYRNHISSIAEGVFETLYSLRKIYLYMNELTSLSPNLFVNQPRPMDLKLTLNNDDDTNLWNCSSLLWLKHEEQHGTWLFSETTHPTCPDISSGNWTTLEWNFLGECVSQNIAD